MENYENLLNVTTLPPREKHPTIFKRFDMLAEGEALTIANDHDPKPLYYQMINERGLTFKWEYLENGPEWWKVRITRQKQEAPATTVGQLAATDFRKAQVFKKYGIDFCCGGKKSLAEACRDASVDVFQVERELNTVSHQTSQRPVNYDSWSLDFLSDYIVNTHHKYVEAALPELKAYAAKVAAVHGDEHPELLQMNQLVIALSNELTSHMKKEEQILFPFVKLLVAEQREGRKATPSHFGSVQNPIKVMELEHENAGEILQELRRLSDDYRLPAEACTSYSLFFSMLQEFEEDLHTHIHLENNILFPKAAALEQQR